MRALLHNLMGWIRWLLVAQQTRRAVAGLTRSPVTPTSSIARSAQWVWISGKDQRTSLPVPPSRKNVIWNVAVTQLS